MLMVQVPRNIGGCKRTSTTIKSNHFKPYPFRPFSNLTYAIKLNYVRQIQSVTKTITHTLLTKENYFKCNQAG